MKCCIICPFIRRRVIFVKLLSRHIFGKESTFLPILRESIFHATSCPSLYQIRTLPDFETDATNDYFDRVDSPGSITFEPPDLCVRLPPLEWEIQHEISDAIRFGNRKRRLDEGFRYRYRA